MYITKLFSSISIYTKVWNWATVKRLCSSALLIQMSLVWVLFVRNLASNSVENKTARNQHSRSYWNPNNYYLMSAEITAPSQIPWFAYFGYVISKANRKKCRPRKHTSRAGKQQLIAMTDTQLCKVCVRNRAPLDITKSFDILIRYIEIAILI